MERIRLRAIKFNTDFRKSELTNYDEFKSSSKFPGELKPNEAFLFVSRLGNQLVWVLNIEEFNTITGKKRRVIDTRRWRIEGTTGWDPMMLANYAESVGIELIGIKKFEEIYKGRRK